MSSRMVIVIVICAAFLNSAMAVKISNKAEVSDKQFGNQLRSKIVALRSRVMEGSGDGDGDEQDKANMVCDLGGKGAAGYSDTALKSFEWTFNQYDTDGNDILNYTEFVTNGFQGTQGDREKTFHDADDDDDDDVTLEEYVDYRVIWDECVKRIYYPIVGCDIAPCEEDAQKFEFMRNSGVSDYDTALTYFHWLHYDGESEYALRENEFCEIWAEIARDIKHFTTKGPDASCSIWDDAGESDEGYVEDIQDSLDTDDKGAGAQIAPQLVVTVMAVLASLFVSRN